MPLTLSKTFVISGKIVQRVKMKSQQSGYNLKEALLALKAYETQPSITIEQLIKALSGKGRSLIVAFLTIPFCQPLQIPGLSTPFGIVITFFGLRMMLGKEIWLPRKILNRPIKIQTLKKITDRAIAILDKTKSFIHPRLHFMYQSQVMEKINGILICILGILLALPLPVPLTNLTSAWSIFLISLGTIENDGLLILLGFICTLLTFSFFLAILISIKLMI